MGDGSSTNYDVPANIIETKNTEAVEEKIFQQATAWHEQFNKEKWQGKESFHNAEHVGDVDNASELAIDEAMKLLTIQDPSPEQIAIHDPLGFVSSVLELMESNNITIDKKRAVELARKGVKIGTSAHDLGNIMKGTKEESGKRVPDWQDTYVSKDAEDRSKQIAKDLMQQFELQKELEGDELRLVEIIVDEFIEQTRYKVTVSDQDRAKPLSMFTTVVDQIGNRQKAGALVEELVVEFPQRLENPGFFFNFALKRFDALLPDKNKQQRVWQIWKRNIPVLDSSIPDTSMTMTDMYNQYVQGKSEQIKPLAA